MSELKMIATLEANEAALKVFQDTSAKVEDKFTAFHKVQGIQSFELAKKYFVVYYNSQILCYNFGNERLDCNPIETFKDLTHNRTQVTMGIFDHFPLPIEDLRRECQLQRYIVDEYSCKRNSLEQIDLALYVYCSERANDKTKDKAQAKAILLLQS